jgi:hypothetical protein
MYRVDRQTYYGKYVFDDIYIDEEEDHLLLDKEITPTVLKAINRFRLNNNEEPTNHLKIGILSFCPNVNVYSSSDEIEAFDFYCISSHLWSSNSKIYINGVII